MKNTAIRCTRIENEMPQWEQIFKQLTDYISKNPSIKIDSQVIIIPDAERLDFYRFFNETRRAFVNGEFAAELEDTYALREHFIGLRESVITALKLNRIQTNVDIERYLQDPVEALAHRLYDPLLDVLRGAIIIDEFTNKARNIVSRLISTRYAEIYRDWVALALISIMRLAKSYTVPIPDQFEDPELTDGETVPGLVIQEMPNTMDAREFRLNFSQYTPLIVPNIILEKETDSYIALRFGYNPVFRRVPDLNKHGEWSHREDIHRKYGDHNLWPDLGIYLSDEPKWLKVLADYYYISRPDIIIDIYDSDVTTLETAIEIMRRHIDIMKPRIGGILICRKPLTRRAVSADSKGATEERSSGAAGRSSAPYQPSMEAKPPIQATGIPVLIAGYEAEKLKPILEIIQGVESQASVSSPTSQ